VSLETRDFPVQSLGGSLGLVVMSEEGAFSYPLPKQGQVTLGRDPACEIRLHGYGVSRQHARLRVGATVQLVDLTSRNGTQVGDRRLVPNEPVEIHLGDTIRIGEVVLVLQPQSECSAVRFFTRSAFEAHVDREVLSAAKTASSFAFARVAVESINTAAPADGALARLMSEALEPTDLLCTIGPRDVEVVLGAVTPAGAEDVSTRIQAKLSEGGFRASVGLAFYPDDAETREQLQRVAESRLRGAARSSPRASLDTGALKKLVPVLERIASSTINVIIAGETGVGKEVLAHAIHELSPRAASKLVCLNCCALSETLLESELFGHERGAFTGAVRAKPGLLETADGGTLFLDEVGEMPLALQAKFLRVLEQKEVTRVGALRPRPIDIRILSASNRDLEAEIRAERFRSDLFFRLNGVTIVVPPLRERIDEIEPLARSFVENTSRALGRRLPAISAEALTALRSHSWPGNVRELRNVIERAVVLCAGDEIRLEHLPFGPRAGQLHPRDEGRFAAALAPPRLPTDAARETLPVPADVSGIVVSREEERQRTITALRACRGNQTRAAEMLGISRRTLVSRLTEFGLPRPRKQAAEPKS
jgi:DNA-binding NtrC family response regulator